MYENQFGLERMFKKIVSFFVLSLLCLSFSVLAEDGGGRIILDLQEQAEADNEPSGFEQVLQLGSDYIQDVKEYNERFEGESIDKDLTEDMRSKYPTYSDEVIEKWQKYVKKGIKGVRFVNRLKNKFTAWIMNQEMPLVVPDNQYEMGADEPYIETDKPLIVQNFKKVVAYSHSKKDRLAADEKFAKDHKLPLVSDKIKRYKKALLERDWQTLFGIDWKASLEKLYSVPKNSGEISGNRMKAVILSQFENVDETGKIAGVLLIEPADKVFVLLNSYQDYAGLKVNFSESENVENPQVYFLRPRQILAEDRSEVLGYFGEVPVYFTAQAKEPQKPVVLKAKTEVFLCEDASCSKSSVEPAIRLPYHQKSKDSLYSSYVKTVSQNIPSEENKKYFSFSAPVFEKGDSSHAGVLRLEIETDNAAHLQAFIIGENADLFAPGRLSIMNGKVVIRYDLKDKEFDPIGHDLTFWVSTDSTRQYLATLRVEDVSLTDIGSGRMSFGVLLMAFFGGIFLNLMPCVFPLSALKLLAFTKFGGTNFRRIRKRFLYTSLGIFTTVFLTAIGLVLLKNAGYVLRWGLQFQNIYFVCAVIWGLVFLAVYFLKLSCLPQILSDTRDSLCEFLSGVLLVVFAVASEAPYLGAPFEIGFAGGSSAIWQVMFAIGVGLAFPYLMIAAIPQISKYVSSVKNVAKLLKFAAFVMLVAGAGRLIIIAAAQSSSVEFWHWLVYILSVFFVLAFKKSVFVEIDKLHDNQLIRTGRFRFYIIFGIVLSALIVWSFVDIREKALEYQQIASKDYQTQIDFQQIQKVVQNGGKVLVKAGADWCLACKYNDWLVFDTEEIKDIINLGNLLVKEADWTRFDSQIQEFMQKFGRYGVPFYVLFSPKFPEGIVLPEFPKSRDVQSLMEM